MSDLIIRKPLVDMLQGVEDDIFAEAMLEVNPKKALVAGVVQEVKNQVIALPAVDAVPVVRCRECFRRGMPDLCPMCARMSSMDDIVAWDITEDDGFCHKVAKMDAKDMDVPTKDGGAD